MPASWPERFIETLPISAEGAFRVIAARDVSTGKECVVASAAPGTNAAAARLALERAYAAHSRVRHPVLAHAIELGPNGEFVVFDCPARLDLAGLLMLARGPAPRVKHGAADGFVITLRDALFAAAEHEHPRGGPCCIGTVGHANILFALDGRFWLFGLGHNLALADEHGRIGGRSTAFHAPEVAVGAHPTRSSDFVALLLLARSLVPFMVLEHSIVRILAGNSLAEDFELVTKLVWFERRVVTAVPHTRAPIEEAIATSDRIRELLGVKPDVDAFRATIAALLVEAPHLGRARTEVTWRVARDGSYVERSSGERIHVPGRGALRRLLVALANARLEKPGAGLDVGALLDVGWPRERMSMRSARNRVHVAVSTLRKLGLASDLESHAGSYRISPAVAIELTLPESTDEVSTSTAH